MSVTALENKWDFIVYTFKTVTSLDASDMLDETENIYENCAVLAAQTAVTPVEDVDCKGLVKAKL